MNHIKLFIGWLFFGCYHSYGRWEPWAITIQRRYCKKCGKGQSRDI